MRRHSRNRNSRRGATLVEFALSALILFVLSFAAFEIGRAVWTFSTVSYATKEGVRYAMIHGADNMGTDSSGNALTQTDIENNVKNVVRSSAPGLDPTALTVLTTWVPNNTPGSKVKVSVEYPIQIMFNPLTPRFPSPGIKTQYEMIVTN